MKIKDFEIRNLETVPSTQHERGYSFKFEALRGDRWISYGPQVLGNWAIASHLEREVLPRHTVRDVTPEDLDTMPLGWWTLNDALNLMA